jgi:hypothetical protein
MSAFTGATADSEQNATINEKLTLSSKATVTGLALAGCLEARGHSYDYFSATLQRIHRI